MISSKSSNERIWTSGITINNMCYPTADTK